MTPLSPHFSLEELTFSSTACRLQIPNDPQSQPDGADVLEHLKVAAGGMEEVRQLLGDAPIHVDSGYRCPALNKAVCGAANSAHLSGYAVDFICPAFGSPADIVRQLRDGDYGRLKFDQLIQEGSWVHISFDPRQRRQVLTAHFGPNGTTYSQGA